MKKVGKTTRSFRYDLNQIPYDYTVKVRNRFKGLDLIDRVPDELWMEVHDFVQETGIKTTPKKKKCKKKKQGCSETKILIQKNRIDILPLEIGPRGPADDARPSLSAPCVLTGPGVPCL